MVDRLFETMEHLHKKELDPLTVNATSRLCAEITRARQLQFDKEKFRRRFEVPQPALGAPVAK